MQWVQDLYSTQPFWIWLTLGVLLLAIEALTSTEWLLWPAVSAGVVALVTALFSQMGLGAELGLFAALTVILTLISRTLIKRVNPDDEPDINDQVQRLIGKEAQVVETFANGRGRVFVSGSEWPAEGEGEAYLAGQRVVVIGVDGSRLTVRPL